MIVINVSILIARIEIEGAGGIVSVLESSGGVEVCIVLLRSRPGDVVSVLLYTLNTGSALGVFIAILMK